MSFRTNFSEHNMKGIECRKPLLSVATHPTAASGCGELNPRTSWRAVHAPNRQDIFTVLVSVVSGDPGSALRQSLPGSCAYSVLGLLTLPTPPHPA